MTFHTSSELLLFSRHWWERLCVQQRTCHVTQAAHLDIKSALLHMDPGIWTSETFSYTEESRSVTQSFPKWELQKGWGSAVVAASSFTEGYQMWKSVRETYSGLAGEKKRRRKKNLKRSLKEKKKIKVVHQWAQWQHPMSMKHENRKLFCSHQRNSK